MSPTILAPISHLRRGYRRSRYFSILQCISGLGLIPMLIYAPRYPAARNIALVLLGCYLIRQIVQGLRAHFGIKQLGLEEHFIRHIHDPDRLHQCLRTDDHLWGRSVILQSLRRLLAQPVPGLLLIEEKQQHAAEHYRRAFRRIRPAASWLDLLLLLLLGGVLAFTPLIPIDLHALMFQSGLMALALTVLAEGSQCWEQRRMAYHFTQLSEALGTWTLTRQRTEEAHHGSRKPYGHTLLYQAPPWFIALTGGLRHVA